jgi:IstB-like ATP binding protein
MSTVATIHLLHWPDVQDIRFLLGSTALFLKLAASDWIAERRNLLLTGARGLRKSWLACALGHKACRENMSVLYTRPQTLRRSGHRPWGCLLRSLRRGDDHYLRTAVCVVFARLKSPEAV